MYLRIGAGVIVGPSMPKPGPDLSSNHDMDLSISRKGNMKRTLDYQITDGEGVPALEHW